MDQRFWKFSDAQLALMLGALNDGTIGMSNRLLCEVSYRLMRSGGAAMTDEEEDILDALMTHEYRLRDNRRKRRRKESSRLREVCAIAKATPKRMASVRPIR